MPSREPWTGRAEAFASFPEFPAGQGAVEAAFGKRSEEYPFALRDVEAMQREVKNRGGKIGVLFLVHANPFYSTPSAERLLEVLDENSLVVSFSPLPDESGRYADYVLPDHSFLERWQDAVGPSTFPNAVLGLTRPVSHPLFDTRHCGDVLLDLARRTVAGGRQSFPWSSFEDLLKWSVQGVFRARRGSVFTTHQEAAEIRQMERRGWWIPSHPSFTAFWNDALATGGWWDPSYPHGLWGRAFRTPSRHFEFFSRGLSLQVHARDEGGVNGTGSDPGQVEKRLEALGIESTGDTAFLPHYEPPKFEGERNGHTLLLQLTRPMVPNTAVAATLPWVRELMSDRVAWETWVEIHAEDAGKLHLGTGDLVRVSAGSKSFLARAVITDSVPPGL
ncbi:MAG: molybdopterin dinucleotide binding domain-containing protein, partial [Planctomycetota bacterium]